MDSSSKLLICPNCYGSLIDGQCADCGEIFVSRFGIMDLRWPRPAQNESENQLIREMSDKFESATFKDLSELVYINVFNDLSGAVLGSRKRRFLRAEQIGKKMMDMFRLRLLKYYKTSGNSIALDIGCGYGAATISLAKHFNIVVGLDPYLPSLLRAQKFIKEHKIQNIYLVQAYAQNIPILDKSVDFAVAQNVIEHLFKVAPALLEVRRVLRQGGCFCGDSRNRFDLFFPEPHTKLRWVGLLPRKLQPMYVRKFRNISYSDVHLLSLWELRRYAYEAFGGSTRIVLPLVSAYGQSPELDKWIERIDRIPIIRDIVSMFFPSHLLIAQST